MKVDTQIIQEVLQKNNLDKDVVRKIYDEVRALAEAQVVPRSKAPKKPFVILVSDANGIIPVGTELVGWAVQVDAEKDITTIPESIQRVAQDFNTSKKGEKIKATSIGDVFDSATGKQFVEHGLYRKHKEPVFLIVTDNKVIMDTGKDDAAGEVVFQDGDTEAVTE